jgi:hypothetical protein
MILLHKYQTVSGVAGHSTIQFYIEQICDIALLPYSHCIDYKLLLSFIFAYILLYTDYSYLACCLLYVLLLVDYPIYPFIYILCLF